MITDEPVKGYTTATTKQECHFLCLKSKHCFHSSQSLETNSPLCAVKYWQSCHMFGHIEGLRGKQKTRNELQRVHVTFKIFGANT